MPKRINIFLKAIACCFLFCIGWLIVTAQKKGNAKEEKKVVVSKDSLDRSRKFILMGKYIESYIVLRWAPKTAVAWEKANTTGYSLYRFEADEKSGTPLSHETLMTSTPIKPFTLDEFKQKFKPEDTAAAVAAEVLYGKKYETKSARNGSLNWSEAYTKFADMDNRLGIALFNADVHTNIADAMGWRWEDKTVEKGKMYYYVLISPAVGQQPADTVTALISTKQSYKVPAMLPVMAMPWDKTITLYWNRKSASRLFSCYYIERSDDNGRSFHRINSLPYVDGSSRERTDWIHYTDSISQNYKLFTYRVRGVTAFGELSDPSAPVMAAGSDKTSPASPINVKAENTKGSEVKISWQKPLREKDLAGFLIGRGSSVNGPFFPLDTVLLAPTSQSFTDHFAVPWDKNFYIVAAIDTAGNAARSMPAYAILVDSIPPAVPVGLMGSIDTLGVVRLHWRWNKELDLQGYNVYASNNPSQAFYILNSQYITDSSFKDTISIKTLTRHIYYRICAFDKTGNPSPYSKILELTKPDIIPPTAPAINHFLVTDSSVVLQWAPSSSEDVARQIVWRKEKGVGPWMRLDSLQNNIVAYADRSVQVKKEYDYALTAVDSSGLSSDYSFPIHARIYDNGKRKEIESLRLLVTDKRLLQLSWKYSLADRQHIHFIIYRNYNNNGLEMYKNINGDKNEFTDTLLPGEGNYQYAIKVVTDDGGASALVPSQTIKLEKKSGNP